MLSFILDFLLTDLRKTIFEFYNKREGHKILDVGCGKGSQLFYFKRKFNNKIFLFGIDINKDTIKKAKKRAKKYNFKDIKFLSSDAKNLPFLDNYFNTVLISLLLHENEKEKAKSILNEAIRVLKNGGELILADFNSPLSKNFTGIIIGIIEFLVGKENYKNFKNYLEIGGLDYFLKNLKIEKERFLKSNNIRVLKIKIWKK